MPRSRMRLDLARFKKERYAGIILLIVAAVTGLVAAYAMSINEMTAGFYTGRLEALDPHLIRSTLQLDHVIRNETYVAVMFEAPGCKVCEKMEPYWKRLEAIAPRLLGVKLYHIIYSPRGATEEAFSRYEIQETPTFIFFAHGEPVARWVGGFPGPNVTESMLEWLRSALREAKSANTTGTASTAATGGGEEATSLYRAATGVGLLLALAAAVTAGVLTTFSPCVLPVLLVYVSSMASSGRRLGVGECSLCGAAAAAGALGIAALFVAAGSIAAGIQELLMTAVAVAVVAVGVATALGVPMELGSLRVRRGGFASFCGLYGILALQCTLPFVAGALLLAMGTGSLASGLTVAVGFAAGLGGTLAATLYAATRLGSSFVNRVLARTDLLNRIGGAVMVAAGVYLLAYNLGLV